MENAILRFKNRLESSSDNSAPEYIENSFDVELTLPSATEGINSICIRIYNPNYKLACAACISHNPDRKLRKAHLEMAFDDSSLSENCTAYVFLNNSLKWFCHLDLKYVSIFYLKWSKHILEPVENAPEDVFFIEKLSTKSWWDTLKTEQLPCGVMKQLIKKLCRINIDIKDRKATRIPNMLVAVNGDENDDAKFIASKILARFIADNDESKIGELPLEGIVAGYNDWTEVPKSIAGKNVAIAEIPYFIYDTETANMVNLIASIIKSDVFKDTTFVFYGTQDNIDNMMGECKVMSELFNENTTFTLAPGNTTNSVDEDEEFQKILKDFINTNPPAEHKDAAEELEKMVGLQRVKDDIKEARMMSLFNKKRADMNLQSNDECRNHMLFLGNPGTGKTTVARLVGQMYHDMGLLSKGHTVETDRSKLVGEYIGLTEKNTLQAIEEARGGVLFIDEAYTLIQHENDSKDFGKEVLNSLLTVLSEPNPDMIIILAGYKDKMNKMLKSNQGLRDRFPLTFYFEDYSSAELMEIAQRMLNDNNYKLTRQAYDRLYELIKKATSDNDCYFSNGRWISNLINHGIIKSMAKRVMSLAPDICIDKDLMCDIEEIDVLEAEKKFLQVKTIKLSSPQPIGFRA